LPAPYDAALPYELHQLEYACRKLKVRFIVPSPPLIPVMLYEILIEAIHGYPIPRRPVPPDGWRTIDLIFTDESWWREKGLGSFKRTLQIHGLSPSNNHKYIKLHADAIDVKYTLSRERTGGQNVVIARTGLNVEGDESPAGVAAWCAQLPPRVRTVLLVDITGQGPPGDDHPVHEARRYCDRAGVLFAFVTDEPICLHRVMRVAVRKIALAARP
jgi:hypothetical protein